MDCITKNIHVAEIIVSARIRKDMGGYEDLAEDIRKRGLINPVTVMDCGDGRYQLIAGLRRLEACKRLGHTQIRASIFSPLDAEEQLRMEYAENVQRKDFTTAERLEYADKIKAVEKAKARERMSVHARDGHSDGNQGMLVRSYPEKGTTRNRIAKKVGFSSGVQYERAERVAAKRPELLDKIDAGETTIYGAYKEAMNDKNERPAEESPTEKESRPSDQVARAGHERLMKNPLYSELYAKWKQAVADKNIAVTELEYRSNRYENQIRSQQENIEALKRQCDALEQENAVLRAQLDIKETAEC